MQLLSRPMGLLALGLILSGCTTLFLPAPPSPELEISSPSVESLEKEQTK